MQCIYHRASPLCQSSLIQSYGVFLAFVREKPSFFAVSPPLPAMEPARPKFCGPYQQARQVKGRPMCLYTKLSCPNGLHACQSCGRPGHGAEECRFTAAQPQVVPPRLPLPPKEETPESWTDTWPVLEPPEVTSKAVFVPGFGSKGEGKAANYGLFIAAPSLIPPAALPPAVQQASSSSGLHGAEAPPSDSLMPRPIPATTEYVEEWVSKNFKPLTNISTKTPPEVGEIVLWRGLKTSKRGGPSTTCEYFNGKVRHLQVEEDNELYLYID